MVDELVIVRTNVVSDVQVGKEDLIAIAISKHEQDLLAKEVELANLKKKTSKELRDSQAGSLTLATTVAEGNVAHQYDAIEESLRQLGFGDVKRKLVLDTYDENKVSYSVTLSNNAGYNRVNIVNVSKTGEKESPAELVESLKKTKRLEASVTSIQEQRFAVKKALNNLSSVERSARATIAKNILSQSEEGRLLLEQISTVTGIPGVKLLAGE